MNKYITTTAIVSLVIGLGIGYAAAGESFFGRNVQSGREHMNHEMPQGTSMGEESMDMDAMMKDMNKSLEGKEDDAFDQEFLEQMIVHHQGAVDMAQLAKNNAKHQEIKDLADAIIKAQNKEISEMRSWQTAWYPQN